MSDNRFDISFCSREFVEVSDFDAEPEKKLLSASAMKKHRNCFHYLIEGHANIYDNLLTVMNHDQYEDLEDDDKTMFSIHHDVLERYGFSHDNFDLFYQMNVAYFHKGYHPLSALNSFASILKNMNEGLDQCCKEYSVRSKESNQYPEKIPLDLKKRIREYKRSVLIYRYGYNKTFENH